MKIANKILQLSAERTLEPLRTAARQETIWLTPQDTDRRVAVYQEIEGVHFDATFVTPYQLGKKTLGVALYRSILSGIQPNQIQVTMGITQATNEAFITELYRGMAQQAGDFGADLSFATSFLSPLGMSITFLLEGKTLSARPSPGPGEVLAITGTVGSASAGLHCLRRFGWPAIQDYAQVVRAHLMPTPPLQSVLDPSITHSVSSWSPVVDGLCAELHTLSSRHRLGIHLEEKSVPIDPRAQEAASVLGVNLRRWALFGSDDFQLMLTLPLQSWKKVRNHFQRKGVRISAIGETRPTDYGIKMANLEGEIVELVNRSWNPLVRRKVTA